MGPLSNRFKIQIYFYSLTFDISNFASEAKVILGLKSTIPDGQPAGLPDREAGNRTSYSPVGAWTGAELGNIETLHKFHNFKAKN